MNKDFTVVKGKTFSQVLRWEAPPFTYKPITDIPQAAPLRITCPSHGLKDGWRVMIESVKGMTNLNDGTWRKASVIDVDTIELNDVNGLDFKAYASGGVVKYLTPVNLTGYTARMSIKDKVGGTEILSLTTENNRIEIDTAASTITLELSAEITAGVVAKKGVYDLEMVSASGVVTGLLAGTFTFMPEVTV